MIQSPPVKVEDQSAVGSWLAACGLRMSDWFERWFPDAFALALLAVIVIYIGCIGIGSSPIQTAQWFGAGFWDLVNFTMQMTMIVVSGYALATARPVYVLILKIAAIPKTAKGGETIHLILEATDAGTPALTRYQRVMITVREK